MHPAKTHRFLNLTWRQLLIAALCQLLASTALYAQISNASINGTVRDATGAVVPETVGWKLKIPTRDMSVLR